LERTINNLQASLFCKWLKTGDRKPEKTGESRGQEAVKKLKSPVFWAQEQVGTLALALSKFLRQSFHEWAGHSIRFCPWARAFYQQQHTAARDIMLLRAA